MERVGGIEPPSLAWEANALPLCYTRNVQRESDSVAHSILLANVKFVQFEMLNGRRSDYTARSMKRIVICSDGTWDSPEEGCSTHVLRLARGIQPLAPDGVSQVVFYDWGVGSDRRKWSGGLSGAGVDKNILDAYRFLIHNYSPGDQLYFFGFSRGAYTVRSLAGLIRNCGILKRECADQAGECYALYRSRLDRHHPDSRSSRSLRRRCAVEKRTPIRFVGVWETVGSLGIPVPFWGMMGREEYLFHDISPSGIIQTARQALALDENRADFSPVHWEPPPGRDVREVWFAGVHGDVGGGAEPASPSADIPFLWILREAMLCGLSPEPFLLIGITEDPTASLHRQPIGIYHLRPTARRSVRSQDWIHRSVKARYEKQGARWKSPAFRALFHSADKDWSRVPLEG